MKNYYVYLTSGDRILNFVLYVKATNQKNAVIRAQEFLNESNYLFKAMDASFPITREFPEFTFVNRVTETIV